MKNSMKSSWVSTKFFQNKVRKFYFLISTIYILGLAWVGMNVYSGNELGLFCPWKKITGIPCPACGLTTGTLETIHGDVLAGFRTHPLSIVVIIVFLLLPIWLLYDVITGKKSIYNTFITFQNYFKQNKVAFYLGILLILFLWVKNIFHLF